MTILLTVTAGPHAGRTFRFDRHDTFLVGRAPEAHFSLPDDPYFSRMHFLVEANPPLCRLTDLASRNGTEVNGRKVQSGELRHGDRITSGRTAFEVAVTDAVGQTLDLPPAEAAVPATVTGGRVDPVGGPGRGVSPPEDPNPSLSLSAHWRIDSACMRFEEMWKSGRQPRLEDFLGQGEGPEQQALLRELLLVDLHYRGRLGEKPTPEEYRARFPQAVEMIDAVLAGAPEAVRGPGAGPDRLARVSERLPVRLAGYEVLGELGRGGMGVVYRARRTRDGVEVAVKTIRPLGLAGSHVVERFLRETSILKELRHPNIVAFHESGQEDGVLFFVMELAPGIDADKLVREQGPLEVRRAVRLTLDVLAALEYAHGRGFIHRDIKPANLLVTNTPEGERGKLADFGLARAYQESPLSGLTLSGTAAGTPHFMPPEQITDFRGARPAADQYSAAATLCYLLTGRHTFDGGSHSELFRRKLTEEPAPLASRRADLPAGLAAAVDKALARRPEARFADVAAFARALRPWG
jgi:serine/threonine-protein kinase